MMLAVAALSACSKSSDSSNNTNTTTTTVSGTTTGSTTLDATTTAQCNYFIDPNGANIAGRIETFTSNGSIDQTKLKVRVTSLSSAFDSQGYNLEFFQWKADASGPTLQTSPLSFSIYYNNQQISGEMTQLNSATISSLKASTGIPSSNSQDFLSRVTIVIDSTDSSWEVLKVALYGGTSTVVDTDSLMPVFYANPNTYASTHVSILSSVHPFYSQRSQAYTDQQWVNYSNQNCFQ